MKDELKKKEIYSPTKPIKSLKKWYGLMVLAGCSRKGYYLKQAIGWSYHAPYAVRWNQSPSPNL
jgi:hypothetical protein